MAYSYTSYTGDGSTTDYAVVFPYLDTDHVNLTVDGVSVSFSWVNSGTVRAAVAPANATVVRVSRSTSRDVRIKNYADLQMLNMEDMNADAKQLFYVAQEAFDAVAEAPSGGDLRAVNNLSEVSPSAARANIGALASTDPAITGLLTLDDAPTDPLHATTKAYVDALVAAIPPGTGETNTMASVGAGASLYKDKSGVQFRLKSLVQGTGVLLTAGADTIQIDATGVGGGEVNIGASVAVTGEQLYTGKSGVALQFKGIANGTGIAKTVTAGDVAFSVDQTASLAWTGLEKFLGGTAEPAIPADVGLDSGITAKASKYGRTAPTSGAVEVNPTRFLHLKTQAASPGYEWADLVLLDNYATAGNNVAYYAKAYKRSTGPTWAGVFESSNFAADKDYAIYGIEVSCQSDGTLTNGNSGPAAFFYGALTDSGDVESKMDHGLLIAPIFNWTLSRVTHGVRVEGRPDYCFTHGAASGAYKAISMLYSTARYSGSIIDLAACTTDAAALRIAAGSPIRVSGTDGNKRDMVWNASSQRMEFQFDGTNTFDIPIQTGTAKTYAFGMRTTAASNFTKTSPTDGAASPKNPVTYIRVQVDGANYRLALYND